MRKSKLTLRALYQAGVNTLAHDGFEHAGYLAFLALLSLFPFLVFTFALAGFIGQGAAGKAFFDTFFFHLPPDMIEALKPRMEEIISGVPQGLITVSVLGAIWSASSQLDAYRTVLNRAYQVKNPPSYIWRRLYSIIQTLVLSFVLVIIMMILLIAPTVIQFMFRYFPHLDNIVPPLLLSVSEKIPYLGMAAVFMLVSSAYYFLPNVVQSFRSVLAGSLMATGLLVITAQMLAIYFKDFSQLSLIYGSLGGIIATLLFFYVINIIFIFGAEFNYLLNEDRGKIKKLQQI